MTPIDLHSFLRTRRSIRRFKPDAVADSVLTEILRSATFAPSAHNRQPWRFAIVTDACLKERFADEMAAALRRDLETDAVPQDAIKARTARARERIFSAPVVIVLSVDMSEMETYSDRRRKKIEYVMATQSAAAAGMQLLLAAHAEGLGAAWICSPLFAPEVAQTILNLPGTWEPQALFLLGYPNETPSLRERKTLAEIAVKDGKR